LGGGKTRGHAFLGREGTKGKEEERKKCGKARAGELLTKKTASVRPGGRELKKRGGPEKFALYC